MTKAEILKRLNALIALPVKERPISVYYLEILAGISKRMIYEIVETNTMSERTRLRLSQALTWVENDQVRFDTTKIGQKRSVSIVAPTKPCVTMKVVKFGPKGATITQVAYNPNALSGKSGN